MREQEYDQLAPKYDGRYLDADSLMENELIRLLSTEKCRDARNVLDVGCGTGLALDLNITRDDKYTGIDPSPGMLEQLLVKHYVSEVVHETTFETFYDLIEGRSTYDFVLSLFGSPSYIDSSYIEPLATMAPGAILMFYAKGYWPEFEPQTPTMDESREEAVRLCRERGGAVFQLNNFVVTVFG